MNIVFGIYYKEYEKILRKEGTEIDNNLLPKSLFESQLTVPSFVALGVTKFILTNLSIINDVYKPVSAMKQLNCLVI